MADRPPPPATVSAWTRILWRLQAAQPASGFPSAYDYWADLFAVPAVLEDPDATEWRRFQIRIEDTSSTEAADDFVTNLDVVNYTNGSADNTWVDTDYTWITNELFAFFTAVMPLMNTRYRYAGYRAYRMAFLPVDPTAPKDKPFMDSGPPEFIQSSTVSGGSAGTLPPQPACTMTEITAARPNWGRWYLPCPAGTSITGSGRLTSPVVDQIALAGQALYENLFGQQLLPVVPATSSGGRRIRALQTVNALRVDDVIDVQRSRRHKFKSYFKDVGEITPISAMNPIS